MLENTPTVSGEYSKNTNVIEDTKISTPKKSALFSPSLWGVAYRVTDPGIWLSTDQSDLIGNSFALLAN